MRTLEQSLSEKINSVINENLEYLAATEVPNSIISYLGNVEGIPWPETPSYHLKLNKEGYIRWVKGLASALFIKDINSQEWPILLQPMAFQALYQKLKKMNRKELLDLLKIVAELSGRVKQQNCPYKEVDIELEKAWHNDKFKKILAVPSRKFNGINLIEAVWHVKEARTNV